MENPSPVLLMRIMGEREGLWGVEWEAWVLRKGETRRGGKRESKGGKYDQKILCTCMKMS